MVKELALSNGEVVILDDRDYGWASKLRWQCVNGYAVHAYNQGEERGIIGMHHIICAPEPGMQVDHINGQRLDNRRSNLRQCTAQQNHQNTQKHSDGTNPYKGVYVLGPDTWVARIRVDARTKHLGVYDTAELAALAYDRAAEHWFGVFARLNFPERKDVPAERERRPRGAKPLQPGEASRLAKLTWAQAEEVRRRRQEGENLKDLAVAFGISVVNVSHILTGRTYAVAGREKRRRQTI